MNNPFDESTPIFDLLEPYRGGDDDDFSLDRLLEMANKGAVLEKIAVNFDFDAWNEKYRGLHADYPREVACFVDMWMRGMFERFGSTLIEYDPVDGDERGLISDLLSDPNLEPHKSPEYMAKIMLASHELCDQLCEEGLSEEFAEELSELVNDFNFEARLVYDNDEKRFVWKHSVAKEQTVPFHHWSLLHFCMLIELGELKSLKRCELEDCGKFHVRRGKWCSDNCGSLYRGRNKRKRDKAKESGYEDRYIQSFFD